MPRRDAADAFASSALKARKADVHFTIDAEEADRLELQLDMHRGAARRRCALRQRLGRLRPGDSGLSEARRAAVRLGDRSCARAHGRKLMVRLVKGAYWDTEIKAAQVGGPDRLSGLHPQGRDRRFVSRLRQEIAWREDAIYPAFATHNANTIAPVKALAGGTAFEFQRLHGMGEELYEELAGSSRALASRDAVRIYAPVGSHKDLLAYLVRRLLENGANSTSSTASPMSRCRSTSWCAIRSPSSTP